MAKFKEKHFSIDVLKMFECVEGKYTTTVLSIYSKTTMVLKCKAGHEVKNVAVELVKGLAAGDVLTITLEPKSGAQTIVVESVKPEKKAERRPRSGTSTPLRAVKEDRRYITK